MRYQSKKPAKKNPMIVLIFFIFLRYKDLQKNTCLWYNLLS